MWTSRNLRLNVSLFLAFIAFNAKQKSLIPYIIKETAKAELHKSAWAYNPTDAQTCA